MILDSGICTIFRRYDVSEPGDMPQYTYMPIYQSWYGELAFESSPRWPTQGRKEQRVDKRIRIFQCEIVRQHDVVILEALDAFPDSPAEGAVYEITRAYHGADEDNPDLITDLSLEVMVP